MIAHGYGLIGPSRDLGTLGAWRSSHRTDCGRRQHSSLSVGSARSKAVIRFASAPHLSWSRSR